MDEHDTYRILRQVPFNQLTVIVDTMGIDEYTVLCNDTEKKKEFLASHGWTDDEFTNAVKNVYK